MGNMDEEDVRYSIGNEDTRRETIGFFSCMDEEILVFGCLTALLKKRPIGSLLTPIGHPLVDIK